MLCFLVARRWWSGELTSPKARRPWKTGPPSAAAKAIRICIKCYKTLLCRCLQAGFPSAGLLIGVVGVFVTSSCVDPVACLDSALAKL